MNPDDYCRDKVLGRGTSLYYALLFLPTPDRASLAALYTLREEVRGSIEHSNEASVAHARLAWWRDEILRIGTPAAAHPVARALSLHGGAWLDAGRPEMDALVRAVETELSQSRFLDFAALEALCRDDAGSLARLCSRALGIESSVGLARGCELGICLALAEIAERVGLDARVGRIYLPVSELQRFGVPAADILAQRHSSAFEQLMAFQVERVRSRLFAVLAELSVPEWRALRPLLILAAFAVRVLRERERESFKVLQHQVDLTPLRKFLTGWGIWTGLERPL
jgi:phytoene synthase